MAHRRSRTARWRRRCWRRRSAISYPNGRCCPLIRLRLPRQPVENCCGRPVSGAPPLGPCWQLRLPCRHRRPPASRWQPVTQPQWGCAAGGSTGPPGSAAFPSGFSSATGMIVAVHSGTGPFTRPSRPSLEGPICRNFRWNRRDGNPVPSQRTVGGPRGCRGSAPWKPPERQVEYRPYWSRSKW